MSKPYADSSALSSLARVERQTGESDDFAHRPHDCPKNTPARP